MDIQELNEHLQIGKQGQFIREFTFRFGSDDSPIQLEFFRGSLRQALVAAFTVSEKLQNIQIRPIVVYLHNDNNANSHRFCREVLCDPEVIKKFKSVDSLVLGYDTTDPEVRAMFGEIFYANFVNMVRWKNNESNDMPLLFVIAARKTSSGSALDRCFRYRIASAIHGRWTTANDVISELEDFIANHLGDTLLSSDCNVHLQKWCHRLGIKEIPPYWCEEFSFALLRSAIFGVKGDTYRYKCSLLAVFLHNSLSARTYDCFTALCDPEIVSILDNNFLLFTRDLTLEERHDYFWRFMIKYFKMVSKDEIPHTLMIPLMIVLRKTKHGKVCSINVTGDVLTCKRSLKEALLKEVDLCKNENVWRKVESPHHNHDRYLPRVSSIDELRANNHLKLPDFIEKRRKLSTIENMETISSKERLIMEDTGGQRVLMCHYNIPFAAYFPQWIVANRRKVSKKPENPFYRNVVMVPTGSREECLSLPSVGLDKPILGNVLSHSIDKRSDVDFMFVVPCCNINLKQQVDSHLVVETSNTRPGFVRLKHICPLSSACKEKLDNIGSFVALNNGSIYFTVFRDKQRVEDVLKLNYDDVVQHGPAITNLVENVELDMTLAVRLYEWPTPDWATRDRPSGWPSKDTIREIIAYGCHLVQVAHWSSNIPEIEWRLSFTVAERILALSLTTHQRAHYIFFKTIISYVCYGSLAISSYCLKNILFWVMEELPLSKLNQNVEDSGEVFSILLDRLIHCLAEQRLPSFFMTENNLFEHKSRDVLLAITKKLVKLRQHGCIPLFYRIFYTDGARISGLVESLGFTFKVSKPIGINMLLGMKEDVIQVRRHMLQTMLAYSVKEKCSSSYIEVRQRVNAIFPELIVEYESQPGAFADLIKRLDLKDPEQYLLGFAWCNFVSIVYRNGSLSREQTQLIEATFKMSLDWMTNAFSNNLHDAHFYYAIFLANIGRFDEAESIVASLLLSVQLDKTYLPEVHDKIFICHIDDCVLDDTLAGVVRLQDDLPFALFDFVSLLYHYLFILRNKDLSLVYEFRKYVSTCIIRQKIIYQSSLQLLQEDLKSLHIYGKLDAANEARISDNLSKNTVMNVRQRQFIHIFSILMSDATMI